MSVIVKGMKMPANCDDCDFVQRSYPEDWCYLTEKNLPCNCPLISVPPHGDLIDRDEQIERAWRLNLSTRELIEKMLKTAPTILEAEVGE